MVNILSNLLILIISNISLWAHTRINSYHGDNIIRKRLSHYVHHCFIKLYLYQEASLWTVHFAHLVICILFVLYRVMCHKNIYNFSFFLPDCFDSLFPPTPFAVSSTTLMTSYNHSSSATIHHERINIREELIPVFKVHSSSCYSYTWITGVSKKAPIMSGFFPTTQSLLFITSFRLINQRRLKC